MAVRGWLAGSATRHGAFVDGCDRHCDGGANVSLPDLFPLGMQAEGLSPLQALAACVVGLPL